MELSIYVGYVHGLLLNLTKVHMHSIKILLWIRINWSDFQTYPYYLQPWGILAFTWVLSNWKTEHQVKHYVSSSLFDHYSRVFVSFQNKTQRFYCMTPSSLSIYMVFVDPHRGITCCAFSLPTIKAYVEFIGREKARAYLQCIYCKVKPRIQREMSHIIKSRYACVWIYVVNIYMVANLILLCSLKTYLSFET
jgi:hypothetical protein